MDFILIYSDNYIEKVKIHSFAITIKIQYYFTGFIFCATRWNGAFVFFFFNAKKKSTIVNVVFTVKRFNYKF